MSVAPPASVMMTVFNRETMVGDAIRSVLSQDMPDFEFVIVDDGSTDRTVEVIRSFDDPRIRLASLPTNCGIAMGRNLGLRLVRGEFVAIMDSDDIAMPSRLRRQCDFLRANPRIDIVGSNLVKVVGDSRFLQEHAADDATIKARLLMMNGAAMIDPTTTMRADFLRRTGLRYRMLRTDLDHALWMDAMVHGARFAVIQDVLMHYHRHEGNITHELDPGYAAHEQGKTPLRARLLGLFFPNLTHVEALAIACWMEAGRRHYAVDVCTAVTAIRRALSDTTSYWGESKAEVARILESHLVRAIRGLEAGNEQPPVVDTANAGDGREKMIQRQN